MSHSERLARLKTILMQGSADEVRVLLLVSERLMARRPAAGAIDASVPRDRAGDVAAVLEEAADLGLTAALSLARCRERQT